MQMTMFQVGKVTALGIKHKGSCVLDLNSLKIGVIIWPHLPKCYGHRSRNAQEEDSAKATVWKCSTAQSVHYFYKLVALHIWLFSLDLLPGLKMQPTAAFQAEFFDAWLHYKDRLLSGDPRNILGCPFSEFGFVWWSFGVLEARQNLPPS